MRGMGAQQPPGLLQRDSVDDPRVQQLPQLAGEDRIPEAARRVGTAVPQMVAQPLGDERQPALRLQLVAGAGEGGVQLPDAPPEHGIPQIGTVDGRSDELVPEPAAVQIDDPLAESPGVAGDPLCGTCGGSSDTVSCGVPCSCRSRSYRTAPSSTMSSVQASWTCIG